MVDVLLGIVGVLVQILFRYVPWFSDWYLNLKQKGPVMFGIVLLVALGYFGLACWPVAAECVPSRDRTA